MTHRCLAGLAALTLITPVAVAGHVPDSPGWGSVRLAPPLQFRTPLGIGVHSADPAAVRRLQWLGVRRARLTLYWDAYRRDPGARAKFAADIRRLADAGIAPLVVLHQPPNPSYEARSQSYTELASFMAARVRQFPEAEAWQLWNEVDTGFHGVKTFGHGRVSLEEQGREYAKMLAVVVPAMRAANPGVKVIGSGAAVPSSNWARGIASGGGLRYLDAFAVHIYGFPTLTRAKEWPKHLRSILGNMPLWVTEFGMAKGVIPPDRKYTRGDVDKWQLEAWRDPVLWNDEARVYARMYGYTLQDDTGDLGYSLVRDNGSWRPAAEWIRRNPHP